MSDPIVALWTTRQAATPAPAPETLIVRARGLRRRVMLRDLREHIAGVFVALAFGAIAISNPDWGVRLACVVLIVGVMAVSANLWRNRITDNPAALGQDSLGYYRAQLVAQREMLASVGRWYLGPILPGMVLFVLAMARASAAQLGLAAALTTAAVATGVIGGVFYAILWLNRRAAHALGVELARVERDETTH